MIMVKDDGKRTTVTIEGSGIDIMTEIALVTKRYIQLAAKNTEEPVKDIAIDVVSHITAAVLSSIDDEEE